jgi:hypothetical protein
MKKLLLALLGLCLLTPAARAQMVNAQTGTTYTVLNTDCDPQSRRVVTFNNSAGVAVTLPQAGLNGVFSNGCVLQFINIAPTGNVTVTPTTSTINGGATLVIPPGGSANIYNDSSAAAVGNYWADTGASSVGTGNNNYRNLLDNGAVQIVQRAAATSATNCGGTSGSSAATYIADRWTCIANVGSQAGQAQVITSSPAPPTGFTKSMKMWRNTGALTQPVCMMQEVPSFESTSLAGQVAVFSFYAQALAGLSADNGNVINAYIMTGTSTDQGLATLTASPAITPAWTNIASTTTKAFTISASAWNRYSVSGTIPSAATEIAVAICFTPTATGSGATDGFAMSGMQLEAGGQPSAFEFRPQAVELTKVQAFYYELDESATVYPVAMCASASVTVALCQVPFPVTMYKNPTLAYANGFATATTTALTTLGPCTTLATNATLATTQGKIGAMVSCTAATVPAAGSADYLYSNAGTGQIRASADF